jgi:VanZ family protein
MTNWIKEEKRIYAWVPAILWSFVILFFSVLPSEKITLITAPYLDKGFHFVEFMVLGFLVVRAFYRDTANPLRGKYALFTLIFAGLYGIVLELLQLFVPGRDSTVGDALMNVLGVMTGVLMGKIIVWRK